MESKIERLRHRLNLLVERRVCYWENRALFARVEKQKWPKESFAWARLELARRIFELKIEVWKSLEPNAKNEMKGK